MSLTIQSTTRSFGGEQMFCAHESQTTKCTMGFSLYLPAEAKTRKVPLIWFLSGLTCTAENATTKAGFQRLAAEHGVAVICPDTSPRGDHVADDADYDLGQGAGFYLTATEEPWAPHYQMDNYILHELSDLISVEFPLDMSKQAITGHSMGGHGALTLFLKNPDRFRAVSAFSPIVAPSQCPWGEKALMAYLGKDRKKWEDYDSCALLRKASQLSHPILIDVGSADPFLAKELKPHLLRQAADESGQPLVLRMQDGYDHSYYFISSFMADHMVHLTSQF